MRRLALAILLLMVTLTAHAQDAASDDRTFLTRLLEDNLSGAGRSVRFTGFAGALSSRATFTEMTIADDAGVWITIRDGAIRWNRAALLRGRIEIDEMSAGEIDLPRAPDAGKRSAAVARAFSLPELPVSVSIGSISADHVVLGSALLGQDAAVRLTGAMTLAGGEGSARLSVARIDGREGAINLSGSYANVTRQLQFDVLAREGPGGIAATLIGLPGAPDAELALAGKGVIDDFSADVSLMTNGSQRLTGQVRLFAADSGAGAAPVRRFQANLSGDLAPLFLPGYRDFFGDALTLKAEGARTPDGRLMLDDFALTARALDVKGALTLLPGGVPAKAALAIRLGLADGGEVLLPVTGAPVTVTGGRLQFSFDGAAGQGWTLKGRLNGFRRGGFRLGGVDLDGSGRITRAGTDGIAEARAGGTLRFAATGIAPDDAALAAAIGPTVAGSARFDWIEGKPLRLPSIVVTGQDYGADAILALGGLAGGFTVSGLANARFTELARLSTLLGRPVGGAAEMTMAGQAALVTGGFDVTVSLSGTDLTATQPELDRLLAGTSRIEAQIARTPSGTEIRSLTLRAATLSAEVAGSIGDGSAGLNATMEFADLSVLGGGYMGRLSATAGLTQAGGVTRIDATGSGRDLRVGQAEADRVLAGQSDLALKASMAGGLWRVETFRLATPRARLTATGRPGEAGASVDLDASLDDLALIAPGFPGPLTATGTARQESGGYRIDLSGAGPGATSATVQGTIASTFATADLALAGTAQSAVLNPFIAPRNIGGPVRFGLRLNGPPSLAALSGTVSMQGGRIVDPAFRVSLTGVSADAALAAGRATIRATADVQGGGRVTVTGPVDLSAPRNADLAVTLSGARLRDPELYDTRASGQLLLTGPLPDAARLSGSVTLDQTEIRVPSTGLGAQALLTGIVHQRDSAPVRETRRRAGLDGGNRGEAGVGNGIALDLTIAQAARLFVRGRGLDAELGGSIRLTGTTAAVVPIGGFDLIRGRLDLLGRRFDIDEGRVQLEGSLVPQLYFAATTSNDGISATLIVEGPADAPEIRFTSTPYLPEEEIVARLLFGRDLTSLSPFQAAQLASAVATLSGRGGEGIVSRLRSSFGLDDFDVRTDDTGSFALRAGKYVSDKVYTDVSVGAGGKTEITLNLDVTPSVKVRGTLATDGNTGLGVFYERDY